MCFSVFLNTDNNVHRNKQALFAAHLAIVVGMIVVRPVEQRRFNMFARNNGAKYVPLSRELGRRCFHSLGPVISVSLNCPAVSDDHVDGRPMTAVQEHREKVS